MPHLRKTPVFWLPLLIHFDSFSLRIFLYLCVFSCSFSLGTRSKVSTLYTFLVTSVMGEMHSLTHSLSGNLRKEKENTFTVRNKCTSRLPMVSLLKRLRKPPACVSVEAPFHTQKRPWLPWVSPEAAWPRAGRPNSSWIREFCSLAFHFPEGYFCTNWLSFSFWTVKMAI